MIPHSFFDPDFLTVPFEKRTAIEVVHCKDGTISTFLSSWKGMK
jgi:hypothetical protein